MKQGDYYTKGEAYVDTDGWGGDERLVIQLPHSCDEWVIGGAEETKVLIDDLKGLIKELENKTKQG